MRQARQILSFVTMGLILLSCRSGESSLASHDDRKMYHSDFWLDRESQAMRDYLDLQNNRNPDAKYLEKIAFQPSAVWYGEWSGNIVDSVKKHVKQASQEDKYIVMVVYNIPERDCGQHSSGGLAANQYKRWIEDLALSIGNAKAIVVLEPDALTLNECLSEDLKEERYSLLRFATQALKRNDRTSVYIDAGHSAWLEVSEVAYRLRRAGIEFADGFALNTSNYQRSEDTIKYGQDIRRKLGGKSFVIDTSRNGNGPTLNNEWCNPRGRAIGKRPTLNTGIDGLDAFLWVKLPGESDGYCNGGPAAGQWWREIAIELARNSGKIGDGHGSVDHQDNVTSSLD